MTDAPPDLVAAYRAAIYEIERPGGTVLQFKLDGAHAALDELLQAQGATSAALITAYNPRSREQSAGENATAHRALLEAVAGLDKVFLHSRGQDPDGTWPAEAGVFILGVTRETASALALDFDQFAYIFVARGAAPELVFVQ